MQKSDKVVTPANVLSELEQFEANLVNFAPIMTSYYGKLVESGLPEELAVALTVHFHDIWWKNTLSAVEGE